MYETLIQPMMKPTVLIVEDNTPLRLAIHDCLTREHFTSFCCESAGEALELYKEHSPQFVLLDIMLPDGEGYDLIPVMREYHDSYILMLTSLSDIESKKIAYENGADDYMTKPFDMDELLFKLRAARKRLSSYHDICQVGDISLKVSTGELMCGNKLVLLPPSQSRLLKGLIDTSRRHAVLSLEDCNREIFPTEMHSRRQLHTIVARLRSSLEQIGSREILVDSVYGKGYTLTVLHESRHSD